jgi:hypothetical protein
MAKRQPKLVDLATLTAHPDRCAGRWVWTEGIFVLGFEASALGPSIHEEDGAVRLTDPVVWIEQAEIRSRRDCFRVGTPPHPSYGFCRVRACGRFGCGEK